jgi:hypothetical protein
MTNKDKLPNAFTIPEKSLIVEANRRLFKKPNKITQIPKPGQSLSLPGSSPYLPPKTKLG